MHSGAQRGERLKAERKRLGWSQQKAADAVGVRREMWAKYEAGAEPGADALGNMQRAGVDMDFVLSGVTEAESLRQRAALHEAAGWPPLEQAVVSLTADERELLALYRAASLTAKMQAVQALQGLTPGPIRASAAQPGTTQVGRGNVSQHIAAPVSGSVAGRDVNAHPPAKKSTRR